MNLELENEKSVPDPSASQIEIALKAVENQKSGFLILKRDSESIHASCPSSRQRVLYRILQWARRKALSKCG